MVHKISHGREDEDDLQDLEQDIYLILLEKPVDFVLGLYMRNELNYYLANIIYTQLRSSSSPYYTKYKKLKYTSDPLDENL